MKVINIDYEYYAYPEGINKIEDFICYIEQSEKKFIQLIRYDLENCSFPYFVEEDVETIYINFSNVSEVSENDVTILSRDEYEQQLKKIVAERCINCESYEEDMSGDNLEGHRDKINLNGECPFYSKVQ